MCVNFTQKFLWSCVVFINLLCIVGLMNVTTWPSSIIVDRDRPAVGVVLDGDRTAVDIDYQSNTTQLCVTFDGFHGAVSYSWAVGTTPGGSDFIGFRDLTPSESQSKRACTDGLNLADDTFYYSTVTATNIVGLTQTVSSDGGQNATYFLFYIIFFIIIQCLSIQHHLILGESTMDCLQEMMSSSLPMPSVYKLIG